MGVIEAVEDLTPGSAVAHDPGRAEQTERVRDRRLRHLDDGGKVAHAQLTCLEKRRQDPDPPRIAQETEQRRDLGSLHRTDRPLPSGLDAVVIEDPNRALICVGGRLSSCGWQRSPCRHLQDCTDDQISSRLPCTRPPRHRPSSHCQPKPQHRRSGNERDCHYDNCRCQDRGKPRHPSDREQRHDATTV